MSVLIIDNKDSFTFNLVELFRSVQAEAVEVVDYDDMTLAEWKKNPFLVISPGPGLPEDFPNYRAWLDQLGPDQSLLGVCMGHEIIAQYFGGSLKKMDAVAHGKSCRLNFEGGIDRLFYGMKNQSEVGLYHSWVVEEKDLPECLEVTARNEEGLIMALRHKEKHIRSVQFHPESYITTSGKTMIENWLGSAAKEFNQVK
jgi:anthranilate synthase/aminodeoxychorismate synthase-like glutamine amidotransferase